MDKEEKNISLKPVGIVRSCFTKKFGIPRQPGIVKDVPAKIEFLPPFNNEQVVRGLEGFSHIWLIFLFHDTMDEGWNNTVRPPRLGGKKRVGVFASRSPYRPNPVGLSVVELTGIEQGKGRLVLHIKGADLMDGTPVIDIKPYLPYSDSIESAKGGYAPETPVKKFEVVITGEAERRCVEEEGKGREGIRVLIKDLLETDPRPAYYGKEHEDAAFGLQLWNIDYKWKVEGDRIVVSGAEKVKKKAQQGD